jgi:hypothetical protein
MHDPRRILRVTSVSPEGAQRARAGAWEFIFACHEANRAADAGSTDETHNEASPPSEERRGSSATGSLPDASRGR